MAQEYERRRAPSETGWRNGERDAGQREDGLSNDEREDLRRLRRENKQLRIERDILKKAAAWLARESDSIPGEVYGRAHVLDPTLGREKGKYLVVRPAKAGAFSGDRPAGERARTP